MTKVNEYECNVCQTVYNSLREVIGIVPDGKGGLSVRPVTGTDIHICLTCLEELARIEANLKAAVVVRSFRDEGDGAEQRVTFGCLGDLYED